MARRGRRSPHGRRRGRVALVLLATVLLATVLLVVGLVAGVPWVQARLQPGLPGRAETEASRAPFAQQRATWAQGSVIHYGSARYDIGRGSILAVTRTPYGFFLDVARSTRISAASNQMFFDGRVLRRLPGEPYDVQVSPGGRYAGWIDQHGPRRLFDRVAQVVVVDVRTGDVVYRSARGMGDWLGRNVPETYEESQPAFTGFDRRHAYYVDSDDNEQVRSVDLRTGRVRNAPRSVGFFGGRDDVVGERVLVDRGRVEHGAAARLGGSLGVRSPDGRFVVTFGDYGRFVVTDAATGRRMGLAGLGRQAFFGGWLEEGSAFYAQSQRRVASDSDPTSGRGRGTIVRCTLPQGACATVSAVTSARPVVLPGDAVVNY